MSPKALPIAITMGDPCGIGPEIIAKLVADTARPRYPLVIIGDAASMRRAVSMTGVQLSVEHIVTLDQVAEIRQCFK